LNGIEGENIQKLCVNLQNAREFILKNPAKFAENTGKPYEILTDLESRSKESIQKNSDLYDERLNLFSRAIESLDNKFIKNSLKQKIPEKCNSTQVFSKKYSQLKSQCDLDSLIKSKKFDEHEASPLGISRKLIRKFYY